VWGADRFGGDGASHQKHATFSSHRVGPTAPPHNNNNKNIVRGKKGPHGRRVKSDTAERERKRERVVLCWFEMTAGWVQVEQLQCCVLMTVFFVFYVSKYYQLPIK